MSSTSRHHDRHAIQTHGLLLECAPQKFHRSSAHPHKSSNIFTVRVPIGTNKTAAYSPRWVLLRHMHTTYMPLKPINHQSIMQTQNSPSSDAQEHKSWNISTQNGLIATNGVSFESTRYVLQEGTITTFNPLDDHLYSCSKRGMRSRHLGQTCEIKGPKPSSSSARPPSSMGFRA